MNIFFLLLVLFSSATFIIYGSLVLVAAKMQNEFKRYKLEKFATLTGVLEIFGGIGLLVGLKYGFFLVISSGGLALLMLIAFGVRIKVKDGFWLSFPSLFLMLLNLYIFLIAL